MHLGGSHVVDKQDPVQKQVERIRCVALLDERWQTPEDALTSREREVLALLVDGLSQNAIAERLELVPKTVQGYIGAIRAKLAIDAESGQGAGPVRTAAERSGISWVPSAYLQEPDSDDPLSLAY